MKADFTSQTNGNVMDSAEGNWFQHNMKMTRLMALAGIAVVALLMEGCAVPYYDNGYDGPYTGPYYGEYGPYVSGDIFITGGHHFYGNGFGHGGYHVNSHSNRSGYRHR